MVATPAQQSAEDGPVTSQRGAVRSFAHPSVLVFMAIAAAAGLVARFLVTSDLWLDEALSVNISKLPLGDIGEALRHDGHPPLYYWLLHGWISAFGDSTFAVRAMTGVISLAALPLMYVVGKRLRGPQLGMILAWMLSISPFFLRYGSETRMYSLVMVLTLAGYLAVSEALVRPELKQLALVAISTGALLWTHYWSMWMLASIGILLIARLVHRSRSRSDTRPTLLVIGAMAVGGVLFLPWVPSLLYQAQHTGTPWADPLRPDTLVITTLFDFNGGPYSQPQILMAFTTVLLVIGVFGAGRSEYQIDLDFRSRADARRPLAVMAVTMIIASAAGMVLQAAFATRYASVFFPFYVILVGLGVSRFRPGLPRIVVICTLIVMSLASMLFVFRLSKTQAGEVADAIAVTGPEKAFVITCPDQLGPSVSRALGDGYDVATYPRFEAPLLVDWVDYGERNRTNDPKAFADEVLRRAGDRTIFVVYSTAYLTVTSQCSDVVGRLGTARVGTTLVQPEPKDFFEPMSLIVFPPSAP